jgi:hypothetical protein
MDGFKQWEQYLRDVFRTVEASPCQVNKDHEERGKIAFICEAPGCKKRLICSMCIVSDVEHKTLHKNYIKRLAQGASCLIERSRDSFSKDIEMIAQDAAEKYSSKLKKCGGLVKDLCAEVLAQRMEIGQSAVEDHFDDKVRNPITELSKLSQQRMECSFGQIMEQKSISLGDQIEAVFDHLDRKAVEDTFIWETAGKTVQRIKHQILYNKQIEDSLNEDVDRLTRNFVENLVEVYKSYFFVDETKVAAAPINTLETKHQKSKLADKKNAKPGNTSIKSPQKSAYQSPSSALKLKASHQKASQAKGSSLKKHHLSSIKRGTASHQRSPLSPANISLNHAMIVSNFSDKAEREVRLSQRLIEMSASSIKPHLQKKDGNVEVRQFEFGELEDKENAFRNTSRKISVQRSQVLGQVLEEEERAEMLRLLPSEDFDLPTSVKQTHHLEECDSPDIRIRSSIEDSEPKEDKGSLHTSQCIKRLTFSESAAKQFSKLWDRSDDSLLNVFSGFLLEVDCDFVVGDKFWQQLEGDLSDEDRENLSQMMSDGFRMKLSAAYLSLVALSPVFPKVSSLQMVGLMRAVSILRNLDTAGLIERLATFRFKGSHDTKPYSDNMDKIETNQLPMLRDFQAFVEGLVLLAVFSSKTSNLFLNKINMTASPQASTTSLALSSK